MNFIEMLLSESLKNRNPLLDLSGTDSKVLDTAYQDFVNYLKVHWNLVGEKGADYKLVDKLHDYFHENQMSSKSSLTFGPDYGSKSGMNELSFS